MKSPDLKFVLIYDDFHGVFEDNVIPNGTFQFDQICSYSLKNIKLTASVT